MDKKEYHFIGEDGIKFLLTHLLQSDILFCPYFLNLFEFQKRRQVRLGACRHLAWPIPLSCRAVTAVSGVSLRNIDVEQPLL